MRRKNKAAKPQPAPSTRAAPKFQAVTIESGTGACAAAGDERGVRYLCDRAPLLPLADCDRPERCACRYVRYSDRRDNPRRKSEGALPTIQQEQHSEERRRDQGRRNEELDAAGRRRPWFKEV